MQELEIISQGIYEDLRQRILYVQQKVQKAVNTGMVQIYWEVGQQVDNACDGKRAEYGKGLIKALSERLMAEFGKGYSVQGLRNMRQFYSAFPIRSALRSELSWTHYRMLMRVSDSKARAYYTDECAAAGWSTRELEQSKE